ncbi:MAG: polyphosphate kinase 2 family protein [Anaerolineaceae bacterium]|nr:polyphosphate kinase 2 family protein [Anaerolineaceae bacterium]
MDQYFVKPGSKVKLNALSTRSDGNILKEDGKAQLAVLATQLADLQELLYAEHKQKVLIVLQGMDTSGKDSTIRHVFGDVNPQGTHVYGFKVPTPQELDHDYLWRVHKNTPGKGEIAIFNRSHYEDVLVVRVHSLVSKSIWAKRYDQINAFEKLLAEEGTTILKFCLHISKEEQAERFLARLDRPTKRWKFNPGDLEEREYWNDYMDAYEDMINRTSTDWAPWMVVPSDQKWYRNLIIAETIVKTLQDLDMQFPKEVPDIEKYRDILEEMVAKEA